MRRWVVIVLCGLVAGVAVAQDEGATAASPEAEEAMAAMMARRMPGEEHEILGHLVGDFTYDITFWMEPGGEPVSATGSMQGEWIMEGRFVQTTWTGDFMGSPFVGRGVDGYNRTSGEYESQWIDNQSTGIMSFTGRRDGDALVLEGENWDAMTGGKSRSRSVAHLGDDGAWHTTAYMVAPDGSEWKQMEIVARRK